MIATSKAPKFAAEGHPTMRPLFLGESLSQLFQFRHRVIQINLAVEIELLGGQQLGNEWLVQRTADATLQPVEAVGTLYRLKNGFRVHHHREGVQLELG